MGTKINSTTVNYYGSALAVVITKVSVDALLSYFSSRINLAVSAVSALIITTCYGKRCPDLPVAIYFGTITIASNPLLPNTSLASRIFAYFSGFTPPLLNSARQTTENRLRESLKELTGIKFAIELGRVLNLTVFPK